MSAEGRVFIDTNVLVYLLSDDAAKAETAERLLTAPGLTRFISTQVIGEFVNVARKKAGLGWPDVSIYIQLFRDACTVAPVLDADQDNALMIAERHMLHWWDSQIIATGIRVGADYLLSEDMQSGMRVASIEIRNPFAQ